MENHFYSMLYGDKNFVHPILGVVNCSSLCSRKSACQEESVLNDVNHQVCNDLSSICRNCYTMGEEALNKWIGREFEEASKLMDYLQQRQSRIPERMSNNSWAIFTNRANLEEYRRQK